MQHALRRTYIYVNPSNATDRNLKQYSESEIAPPRHYVTWVVDPLFGSSHLLWRDAKEAFGAGHVWMHISSQIATIVEVQVEPGAKDAPPPPSIAYIGT
jgi:hypothetical protein